MLDLPPTVSAPARRLFDYWDELPAPKPRKAISPLDLGPDLLPHLTLGRVERDGADLRYELVGAVLKAVAPRLKPGARASDPLRMDPKNRLILDCLVRCARSQRPVVFHARFRSLDDLPRIVFVVLLPLGLRATASAAEDMLIGVWDLREPSGPAGPATVERIDDVTELFLAGAGTA